MSMYKPASCGLLISPLLLSSCGGGKMTPVSDSTLGGLWIGNLTLDGVTYVASAISSESGEFELLEIDSTSGFAAQYWGMISASGDQLSGSFTGAVLGQANAYSDGSTRGTGTVTGTIHERSTLTVTVSFTTSLGKAISGQLGLTYDSKYEQASSLATISENYTNSVAPGTDVLSITSAGDLTYTDPLTTQCISSGTVTVLDSTYSVYAGQMTFGNSCGNAYAYLNGVSLQGLVSLDTSTSPTHLTILGHGMVSGLDTPFALTYLGT